MKRNFRKSSFSGNETNCVEVSGTLDAMRDSKNPAIVLPADMRAVVRLVQAGRFDLPTS